MCFKINGSKTLKLTILRFFAQTPIYIYYLNSSRNIFIIKTTFIIYKFTWIPIISVLMFWNVILVYNQKQNLKTPSNGTLLGRTFSEVFVLLFVFDLYLHFVVVFHSFSGYFTKSPALHPGFLGPWRPSPALSSTPNYFWLPLLFHLPRALWIWVGVFYPQVFFTLHSFPTFLSQPAFRKASLGAGSYSLKNTGLHTDPRNTDPAHLFVWFTVIHNLLYILTLYLCMSILQKFYLWWKLW